MIKNVVGKLPLSLNRSSPKTIGLENAIIAVSYTHLDVYKRQALYSWSDWTVAIESLLLFDFGDNFIMATSLGECLLL